MKFLMSIGYVNRPDLLTVALKSVKSYLPYTIVVDNSESRELRGMPEIKKMVTVYEPPIPLTFTQRMNYMNELAAERKCDVVMYMHNDAEAHPGTPEALLKTLESLTAQGRKWGMAFTNFDILAAFNMDAVREIGPWDTSFPQYFSDIDYYNRIRFAGYEHIWTGLGVTHHNLGMSTLKSDSYMKVANDITWPLYESYYVTKWGLGKWNGLLYQAGGYKTAFNLSERS
jgi:GT2 family glycosyltransferase